MTTIEERNTISFIHFEKSDIIADYEFKTPEEAIEHLVKYIEDYYYDEEYDYEIFIRASCFNVRIANYPDDNKTPNFLLCGMSDKDNRKAEHFIKKLQMTTIEEINPTIENTTIENTTIEEKNTTIEEKNTTIEEKNTTIEEKNTISFTHIFEMDVRYDNVPEFKTADEAIKYLANYIKNFYEMSDYEDDEDFYENEFSYIIYMSARLFTVQILNGGSDPQILILSGMSEKDNQKAEDVIKKMMNDGKRYYPDPERYKERIKELAKE